MSNTTVPETISAPIVPAVRAIDLWLQVIPQSSVPMAFTSLSALVCAVLFGRWLAVVVRIRAILQPSSFPRNIHTLIFAELS